MSDRDCNYCMHQRDKRNLTPDNMLVCKRNNLYDMGGVNVYRVPRNQDIPKKITIDSEFHKKYFVAWYQELPSRCCC